MQRMAHPDGEGAMAKGCAKFGTVMGLSTFSTTSLEDVKAAADAAGGGSDFVLQMYLFEHREISKTLVERAESKKSPPLELPLLWQESLLTTGAEAGIQGDSIDC